MAVPAVGPTHSAENSPAAAVPVTRPLNLRILVAEDVQLNQVLAVRLLKKLGYDAHTVVNGRAAVTAFETGC